jgi:hypothetical protein
MIDVIIRMIALGLISASLCGHSSAADDKVIELRREYNLVSAVIDSLVRAMHQVDEDVLLKPTLPEARSESIVPAGMSLSMIFWADDEARVWLNDFVVGVTRLTPVEVTVPDLYLKGRNKIHARCWDTDWVESGFICGLYLKDGDGVLYPIVVSNDRWTSAGEQAMSITYAHASPDIPGAEPIWGARVFGIVELEATFGQAAVQGAVGHAARRGVPDKVQPREMNYHDFVQKLSVLQARREHLLNNMSGSSMSKMDVPGFQGTSGRTVALTLGKAGPLKEDVSEPISEKVRAWSLDLPAEQLALIYRDGRALKGEEAANLSGEGRVALRGDRGKRQKDYRAPAEREAAREKGQKDVKKDSRGTSNFEGEGRLGPVGGGFLGRASRLGLLVPTVVLGLYVLYMILNWKIMMGRETQIPGGELN